MWLFYPSLFVFCIGDYCDTQVKEWYMNELRPYSNESNTEDRMSKKDLKELKVTSHTNKVHFHFGWLNHTNS